MSNILTHLTERFPGSDAITRAEFRTYLQISNSTDCRLKKSGHYPRVINVTGSERILLLDLAAWLEQGGAQTQETAKKRGRPKGSKNRPKQAPQAFTSPALPAHMAAALGVSHAG